MGGQMAKKRKSSHRTQKSGPKKIRKPVKPRAVAALHQPPNMRPPNRSAVHKETSNQPTRGAAHDDGRQGGFSSAESVREAATAPPITRAIGAHGSSGQQSRVDTRPPIGGAHLTEAASALLWPTLMWPLRIMEA